MHASVWGAEGYPTVAFLGAPCWTPLTTADESRDAPPSPLSQEAGKLQVLLGCIPDALVV